MIQAISSKHFILASTERMWLYDGSFDFMNYTLGLRGNIAMVTVTGQPKYIPTIKELTCKWAQGQKMILRNMKNIFFTSIDTCRENLFKDQITISSNPG